MLPTGNMSANAMDSQDTNKPPVDLVDDPSKVAEPPVVQPLTDVENCVRLFEALLDMFKYQDQNQPGSGDRVKLLVHKVLFGCISVGDFFNQLETILNITVHKSQIDLVAETLPELQEALRTGEVVLDGLVDPAFNDVSAFEKLKKEANDQKVAYETIVQDNVTINQQPQTAEYSWEDLANKRVSLNKTYGQLLRRKIQLCREQKQDRTVKKLTLVLDYLTGRRNATMKHLMKVDDYLKRHETFLQETGPDRASVKRQELNAVYGEILTNNLLKYRSENNATSAASTERVLNCIRGVQVVSYEGLLKIEGWLKQYINVLVPTTSSPSELEEEDKVDETLVSDDTSADATSRQDNSCEGESEQKAVLDYMTEMTEIDRDTEQEDKNDENINEVYENKDETDDEEEGSEDEEDESGEESSEDDDDDSEEEDEEETDSEDSEEDDEEEMSDDESDFDELSGDYGECPDWLVGNDIVFKAQLKRLVDTRAKAKKKIVSLLKDQSGSMSMIELKKIAAKMTINCDHILATTKSLEEITSNAEQRFYEDPQHQIPAQPQQPYPAPPVLPPGAYPPHPMYPPGYPAGPLPMHPMNCAPYSTYPNQPPPFGHINMQRASAPGMTKRPHTPPMMGPMGSRPPHMHMGPLPQAYSIPGMYLQSHYTPAQYPGPMNPQAYSIPGMFPQSHYTPAHYPGQMNPQPMMPQPRPSQPLQAYVGSWMMTSATKLKNKTDEADESKKTRKIITITISDCGTYLKIGRMKPLHYRDYDEWTVDHKHRNQYLVGGICTTEEGMWTTRREMRVDDSVTSSFMDITVEMDGRLKYQRYVKVAL